MELDVRDVAKLMDLPEITILRWIKQGKIPFYLKNGKYVIDKKKLVSWAKLHNIKLKEKQEKEKEEDELITLHTAIERGGVHFGLKGENVHEVLKNAVELLNLPLDVNKDELLEKLIQREELCSTGIGEGVAIPHPRHTIAGLKNMVAVFFLEKEIDFNSVDGKPVFVLFIILASSTKAHLRILSRLSYCLRNKEFLKFLKECKKASELIDQVKKLESEIR